MVPPEPVTREDIPDAEHGVQASDQDDVSVDQAEYLSNGDIQQQEQDPVTWETQPHLTGQLTEKRDQETHD